MLNLNIEFEYWILNLSIEFEYWIWVLNLNVKFEYWILNVKFKCYQGWVGSERLWIYFQVSDIRCFRFRECDDTDGLSASCFSSSWSLRPTDGGTINSSRQNGINCWHCWMWIFCRIQLYSLMFSKFKGTMRVVGDCLEKGELISDILSAHSIYLDMSGVWLGQMRTRWP